MGTSKVYYPHGIYFTGGATITQISELTPAHEFSDLIEFAAGQVGPSFTGSNQAAPSIRVRSMQLKDVLDLFAGGDYGISADFSSGNVDIEWKAGLNLAERKADADLEHIRGRLQENCMAVWDTITCQQGQPAEITFRLIPIHVVANGDPLIFTNSLALTITSAFAHLFTLGPVKLNGTFLTGVESWTLENQIQERIVHSDGDPFPTYAGIDRYMPKLTLRSNNLAYMNTYGTRGTALSALLLYCRKKLASGINVADATEEHIKFTASTGTIKARQAMVDGIKMAEITVDLRMSAVDTPAYTVDTTAAIA